MLPEKKSKVNEEQLFTGVLWLNVKVAGFSLGFICGLAVFIATNWLVVKGGDPVGPHLALLGQYYVGYKVSFMGSIIGFIYGFLSGGCAGCLIGWVYNKLVFIRNR